MSTASTTSDTEINQVPEAEASGKRLPDGTAPDTIVKLPSKRDNEGRHLEPTPTDDPKDPLNFSAKKKYIILALVAFVGFLGPLSSSIYIPALLDMVVSLQTSITVMNATVSLYIFFLGAGPLIWAPLSEVIGRRWVYISSTALYVVGTILCGVTPNIAMFIVMRIVQSIGASAAQAVGAGTITDLFFVHERGTAFGIFFLGPLIGPVVGPIIGGYLNQYLGWRWIFYVKTIVGGIILIATFVYLPETHYPRPLPASSDPEKQATSATPAPKNRVGNPLRPLILLFFPDVFLSSFYLAMCFGFMYLLIAIIPETFSYLYNFNSGDTGLCFLASGVGNVLGAMIGGRYSDAVLRRMSRRNGGVRTPEMRLRAMLPGVLLTPAGFLLYGWALNAHYHWIVPLIGTFTMSVGLMLIMTSTNTYLVDAYHQYSASVIGTANFFRCTMAAITPLFAVQMQAGLGYGWTFTVCGIISFVGYGFVIVVELWGKQWREKSKARFNMH